LTFSEEQKDTSLLEACSDYLDDVQQRLVHSVYKEKQTLMNRILAEWKKIPLAEIGFTQVNKFLLQRAAQLSNNASNKDRKNLHAFFEFLIYSGVVETNPVHKCKKLPHTKATPTIPSSEDIYKILEILTNVQDTALFMVYIGIGARKQEAFFLKWKEDIDFKRHNIQLSTRKTRGKGWKKTWLPMVSSLEEPLLAHYEEVKNKGFEHVFTKANGEPFTHRRKWLESLCKKAEVQPMIHFHQLRYFCATFLKDCGVPIRNISLILRHHSISQTENYLGLNREILRSDLELINRENLRAGVKPFYA